MSVFSEVSYDTEKMTVPFLVYRKVAWGDCDPAGITYTPKTLEYAVEAVGDFFREMLDISWYELNRNKGMGQPFVHTEVDFMLPLRADERFTMQVRVEKLGHASVSWHVTGRNTADKNCFVARLVACFLDREKHQPIPIPGQWRQRLAEYMTAFPVK